MCEDSGSFGQYIVSDDLNSYYIHYRDFFLKLLMTVVIQCFRPVFVTE